MPFFFVLVITIVLLGYGQTSASIGEGSYYYYKIYMENTNLLYALTFKDVNKGTLREVFMVNQLAYQHRVEYCTRNADYTIDSKYTIEVGGKSKDGKQIANTKQAFIAADDIEYSAGNKIPLWAFGFLY